MNNSKALWHSSMLLVLQTRAYTQTLASCNTFAALFDNTCTGGEIEGNTILTSTETTTLTCTGGVTWCVGLETTDTKLDTCYHNYYTCVTCYEDTVAETGISTTMIRVQSNNLPNKCWQQNAVGTNIPVYTAVDFKTTWNADMTGIDNYTDSDFATDAQTDDILCATDRTIEENMNSVVDFWKHGKTPKMDRMVGYSRQNILLYNGLNEDALDVTEQDYLLFDKCLTTTDTRNDVLHAHTLSPCAAPSGGSLYNKPGNCFGSGCFGDHTYMYTDWDTSDGDYGTFYGVALDGHVIYGPYNASDELWACDDVDVCNGFWLTDGSYAYAATTFYPYLVGCWGPGPTTKTHIPGCSTNACGDNAFTLGFSGIVLAALSSLYILF